VFSATAITVVCVFQAEPLFFVLCWCCFLLALVPLLFGSIGCGVSAGAAAFGAGSCAIVGTIILITESDFCIVRYVIC